MASRKIVFNDFFDRPNAIAFVIPGKFAKWWGGIAIAFLGGMLLLHPVFSPFGIAPYAIYWVGFPISLITHGVLVGSKEWHFLSKFHKPKEMILVMPQLAETKTELKPNIGSLQVGTKSNPRKVYPCVDLTDIVAPIQIDLEGMSAGGYLVESKGNHRVVFVYEFAGFPSTISAQQANHIAKKIEAGLRDYKGFELLTLHYGSFASCVEETDYINRKQNESNNEESKFLLSWRKRRTQNLTKLKKHNPKKLRIYYSYTIDAPSENIGEQRIEKFARKSGEFMRMEKKAPIATRLESILTESFQNGFQSQMRFFKKLGFSVRPLSWREAWEAAWYRVNDTENPTPSLLITLDNKGLKYKRPKGGSIPVASQLFMNGAPTLKKDAVFLPGLNKWVGGVVLAQRPREEWDRDKRLEQFNYACEALFSEETHDTEIIVQFTSADQQQALRRARGQTKDSNLSVNIATGKRRIDKGAELNLEQSEGAEDVLRRGGALIKTAWVANIYRDSRAELRRAISSFSGEPCFNGNVVLRESGYFDTLWLETLPFSWKGLLQGDLVSVNRFDRRITETSEATLAFMPILSDTSRHSEGIEFITKGSRTPLKYDPFGQNPHGHCLVSGFSGSGKTQLFQVLAEYAYCTGRKVYFFDADKGTGAGALEDFTKFVGGSYFKASEENSNLFEGVDWRKLSQEKELIAKVTFKSFLVNSLKDLSLPQDADSQVSRAAKDLLSLLIDEFLANEEIQARYLTAWDGGLGSDEWQNIPCLPDFINFASMDRLPSEMQNSEIEAVLNMIKGSLRALTKRPTGKAISAPSTFDRSARFMVFSLGATGDDDDNLPLILSAQGTMLFGALEGEQTLIAQDEASRLFPKFPSIANNCADLYAMGRTLGVWMMLIGQDLNPIADSPVATSIFQNTATYFTGYLQDKTAIEAMTARGIPWELLIENTEDSFFPPKREGARRWLISQGNRHYFGDLYPSFASVGLTMNGPSEEKDEQGFSPTKEQIRRRFFDQYPNKYKACSELAKYLENQSIDAKAR